MPIKSAVRVNAKDRPDPLANCVVDGNSTIVLVSNGDVVGVITGTYLVEFVEFFE